VGKGMELTISKRIASECSRGDQCNLASSEAVEGSDLVCQVAILWIIFLPRDDLGILVAIGSSSILEVNTVDAFDERDENLRKLRIEVDPLADGSVVEVANEVALRIEGAENCGVVARRVPGPVN